jgi:hypothetical protein
MEADTMIAVTIDVDQVAWNGGSACDEMRDAVPLVHETLRRFPGVRATWFVRVDDGMAARYGAADALLTGHSRLIARLRADGHEIAWHHHAVQAGSSDIPELDSEAVCEQLRRHAGSARAHALTSVRLGWAHADQSIIGCLAELGFRVDSTALPRPSYPWDVVPRDWQGTPHVPYRPSRADFRRPGIPDHALLEVPLSVGTLSLIGDTQPAVQRYVNPAFMPGHFRALLATVQHHPLLVTVTHPYEIMSGHEPSRLLAHSPEAFEENLALLVELERPFVTLCELVV